MVEIIRKVFICSSVIMNAVMKKILFLILFNVIRATTTTGISCYRCSSTSSFADCTMKQVVVNCTFPRNHCFKETNAAEGNVRGFFKGCISPEQCGGKNDMFLKCCADDLCNGVCEDDPYYADDCPYKASILDYCKDQETFMRKYCPKSCELCEGGTQTDTEPTQESTHEATHGLTESTEESGGASKDKSAAFNLKIVYYVLSGVAFALLMCFAVGFWCYRTSYRVKRFVLPRHESIPVEKSSEVSSEQTEQTTGEDESESRETLNVIYEGNDIEAEGHVTGVREDPTNNCLSVSIKVLPDND